MSAVFPPELEEFRHDYAAHRAQEGRGRAGNEVCCLPYLKSGRHAKQWGVRARTFDAFLKHVVKPMQQELGRPLRLLDLGAGNGWLSYRLAAEGHLCTAVDIRDDTIDGLGAAADILKAAKVERRLASFDQLPFRNGTMDLAVFNAAIHYSVDLAATLREAARVVRPGGCIAILDSPFYKTEEQGAAMVAHKRRSAQRTFGHRAGTLLRLPFIEFLTVDRLGEASEALGLRWRRQRVLYPYWYELRPFLALLKRQRRPSRFDLWAAKVP